jgi:hypothetical protein
MFMKPSKVKNQMTVYSDNGFVIGYLCLDTKTLSVPIQYHNECLEFRSYKWERALKSISFMEENGIV